MTRPIAHAIGRLAGAAIAAVFVLSQPAAIAQPAGQWVATWGTAPAGSPLAAATQTFNDQTVRMIVHTSVGGSKVRVRISNELGAVPLRIGAARVALRDSASAIAPGTDRVLTFSGSAAIAIPPGAPMLSDPVALDVPAGADLAVSIHLPGETQATTSHGSAFQTSYVSAAGDFTAAPDLPIDRKITFWPFLTQVDVLARGPAEAIVAFGDSITDGAITTLDANRRWPDVLARRLRAAGHANVGIVNRGIGGNRLLRDPGVHPMFGRAALARFERDVLATTGVRHLVVLIGINDIGHPGSDSAPPAEAVAAGDLIAGYRQLIARARAHGIKVVGATLTPFEGTVFPRYYSEPKEQVRVVVNAWIRNGKEFDGVIDFDLALRDPDRHARVLPAYDSGDHLHPNDAGMQAMAEAIPLGLFGGAPKLAGPKRRR